MKLIIALALVASIAVVSGEVLYTRTTVPSNWLKGRAAPAEAKVEFTLALRQRNLDILDKWFNEVSNPDHRNYQEYKSVDEIRDLTSPTAAEHAEIWAWLHSAGIHHSTVKNFGDSMDVETTVAKAEKMFDTKFFVYTHTETGVHIVRQFGSYSVPSSISHLVEMVTGLSTFPIPHLRVDRPNASNDYGVVPQTWDNMYKISQEARALLKAAAVNTSQGVIEFQGQNFAPQDLTAYGQGVNLKVKACAANHIIGPNDPSNPQTEAELDIQMVAGTNLISDNWFWLENGQGWLYQFGTHFAATADVPQVNSISYGWWEGDQCTIDPDECSALGVTSAGYVTRVNTEFQKIAVRGISLLSASGDSGANGRTDPDCTDARLRPAFPGTSPYITAVGATEIVQTTPLSNQPPICSNSGYPCIAGGVEHAVSYQISNFASGGGCSDIAVQPDWQKAAVSAYWNSGVPLPQRSYYNRSGRCMPDVAAVGHNVLIMQSGQAEPVGGTSAASPIFASVIALLNVEMIKLTGKPLGFLNPFLYKMWADDPSTFNDITVGDNKCTEDGCSSSCEGYMCAKGWDPVTGLGTPNFENMLKYVQKMAKKVNRMKKQQH